MGSAYRVEIVDERIVTRVGHCEQVKSEPCDVNVAVPAEKKSTKSKILFAPGGEHCDMQTNVDSKSVLRDKNCKTKCKWQTVTGRGGIEMRFQGMGMETGKRAREMCKETLPRRYFRHIFPFSLFASQSPALHNIMSSAFFYKSRNGKARFDFQRRRKVFRI